MSADPYTAACVRACALRNTLLRPEEWSTPARLGGGTRAAIEWLTNRGVVAEGVVDVLAAERAAHEAVIRTASGLVRFTREPTTGLLRYFIHYYDLLNIERVVHCIHLLQEDYERPPNRFYDTGSFGLLRSATLDAVTNYPALARALRHTPFGPALETALFRYHEDEDVVRLVEKLEVAFFASWVRLADRCGLRPRAMAQPSALGVFFIARAIEAAARLKVHRQAKTARAIEWLLLVAPPDRAEACLACLSRENEAIPVRELVGILLPNASPDDESSGQWGPRGDWGLLDRIVMDAAAKETRGIHFTVDFLTGFLVRQMCQARELTVLLESKEANLAAPAFATRGNEA